jgi:hypothetical protein
MSYTPAGPAAAPPAPPPPQRHALGLPAGSIRALLGLGVLGLLWAIALLYQYHGGAALTEQVRLEFVYLQFLMLLILAHFFAAHGGSIGRHVSERSPLGLPSGSVRFLLLAGYLGLAAYLYYTHPDFELPTKGPYVFLLLVLLSGFCLGMVLHRLMRAVGGGQVPDWFLNFEAWVALLALLGLGVLLMVHVFINPTLKPETRIELPNVEAVLAGLIGFYFGARS